MESGLNQKDSNIVEAEIYINDRFLDVQMTCQNNSRLLDVLNLQLNSKLDFLKVVNLFGSINNIGCGNSSVRFINKSDICFVALSEPNIRRGHGNGNRNYPFINKLPILVDIQTRSFNLSGFMYIKEGQTIQSVFNEAAQFMPLTHVGIINEACIRKLRACVIVNKQHILSYGQAQVPQELAEDIIQRHIDHNIVGEPRITQPKIKLQV